MNKTATAERNRKKKININCCAEIGWQFLYFSFLLCLCVLWILLSISVGCASLRVLYIFFVHHFWCGRIKRRWTESMQSKNEINVLRILNMLRESFFGFVSFSISAFRLALFGLCYAFHLWFILAFSLLHFSSKDGGLFFSSLQMRLAAHLVLLLFHFSSEIILTSVSAVNCKK